jgi:hypothetical protein
MAFLLSIEVLRAFPVAAALRGIPTANRHRQLLLLLPGPMPLTLGPVLSYLLELLLLMPAAAASTPLLGQHPLPLLAVSFERLGML